jgi:chromosomal replication initiator protein
MEDQLRLAVARARMGKFEPPPQPLDYSEVDRAMAELDRRIRTVEATLAAIRRSENVKIANLSFPPVPNADPVVFPRLPGATVGAIKKLVCEVYHITLDELEGHIRQKHLAWPRHIALYLCTKFTRVSSPALGRLFNGRDHSTVIHSRDVVRKARETDAALDGQVSHLETRIQAGIEK